MTNPLIEIHELPPFSKITAEHVKPAIETILADNRVVIENLVKSGVHSWHELVAPLEAADDRLSQAWSPVSHLNAVKNSEALREAYNACLPMISDYHTEKSQNNRLFSSFRKLRDSREFDDLTIAQRRVVENTLRDFKLAGVDLSPDDRTRFATIDRRLSALSSQFSDNVLDATQAWSHNTTEAALAGLPPSALAMLKQIAGQRGEKGYTVTLDHPSYSAILTYCEDPVLRESVYTAYATRASETSSWDNTAIIEEIMSLRGQKAELLGFANYAEMSLVTRMATTTQEVLGFLNELVDKSKPMAEQEFAVLSEFVAANFARELSPWDVAYFAEKLKKETFDISDEETRPYFPAPRVLSGLFAILRDLYDIEVRQSSNVDTWHEDVTTYDVFRDEVLIARCYVDLYARSHKRGGAWMDDCRVRRFSDGHLQLPVAYLTCNFTAPIGDQPALLTHREVVTLFHEFGHGLHHMLTRVDYADVSGINGVAWDAVELPSQFMENWCWQEESLKMISGHYQTGEVLPKDLLNKMLTARNYQSGLMMVRQLEFALFDFRLHTEFDPAESGQVQRILDEVRENVAVIPAPDFHRFQNSFSHIFSGGYAAGYYSYKWAEVLSADAFAKFKEDGLFNRQTSEKFLSTVLEQGGCRDAMELFVEFRGRPPDPDALLIQDGIINAR